MEKFDHHFKPVGETLRRAFEALQASNGINDVKKALEGIKPTKIYAPQLTELISSKEITSNITENLEVVNYADYFESVEKRLNLINQTILETSKKSWPERHPFWFGTIMAVVGGSVGALIPILIEYMSQT